jgi:hypothetical protein
MNKKENDFGTWRITDCSGENFFLKKGDEIIFSEGYISFYTDNTMQYIPIVMAEERLVIKSGTEKLLFDIDKTSDTVWTLEELYSGNPVTFKMRKIKTLKN